jgi:hypothetical protein
MNCAHLVAAWGETTPVYSIHSSCVFGGWCDMKHIRIEHIKEGFQVSIIDSNGHVLRKFTYRTRERARRASAAWAVAHDNCPIDDRTDGKGKT